MLSFGVCNSLSDGLSFFNTFSGAFSSISTVLGDDSFPKITMFQVERGPNYVGLGGWVPAIMKLFPNVDAFLFSRLALSAINL